ncbi:hypothetical protein F7731_10750 [Cytobacillus depressus]|uniref:Uncharacterized protein n=1 Tax=Cytobacillus depressus TaxID=1602942 RepID=A0A6L3V6E3_9BACI|nr:hypothetical protein [Cytobacillus depressus]KAB2336816.1 hypothetical protein F7731_10750 [Cytobacillus depressus]
MPLNGYKFVFVKIITAIVSAIVFSLASSWKGYTPISERGSDIGYYSFGGLFAFNFVPSIFTFFILGALLSPIVDGIVIKRFELKGIKGILTVIFAYVLLGVISGVLVSIFFLEIGFIFNFIFMAVVSSMIFLFFQTVLQFGLLKIAKRNKISY